jgi:putative endonuclease
MLRNQVSTLEAAEEHFVYLACCANGTFYIGYSRNVERRIAVHNAGHGGRYTRSHRPLTLVAVWPDSSRVEALRAERKLKSLPHERKRKLAEAPHPHTGESE